MNTINPESSLQIQITDDISIDSLVVIRANGNSVQRSAHIGNMQPYNMALLQAGIPGLLVDHNVTGLDKAYRPESIMTGGSEETIAPSNQLSNRYAVDGEYLDVMHVKSLRAAIPMSNIESVTSYIRRNESIYRDITRIAVLRYPGLFRRMLCAEDTATQPIRPGGERLAVEHYGILQLNDDPRKNSGVLVPNVVDIVGNFIVECLESDSREIYHLSGPDMINYMMRDNDLSEIKQLYGDVKAAAPFKHRLPETLTVRLVPTADARLASTTLRAKNLDALVDAIEHQAETALEVRESKARFFASAEKSSPEAKSQIAQDTNGRLRESSEAIANVLANCPEVVSTYKRVNGDSQSFMTQYDVLAEGGLYVHPRNTQLTMKQLRGITQTLQKIVRQNHAKT